jgi:cytochrome c556
MRKFLVFLALQMLLLGSVYCASFDVNEDDMREIEDTTKNLDSSVLLKKSKSAETEAREILAYFKQVERFYASKGGAPDAVEFARKSHSTAADILRALESKEFDAAADAMTSLTRNCKGCHDVYKTK